MKRAAIYTRVSTRDQRRDLQLNELRAMVEARSWVVALEAHDDASGADRSRAQLAHVLDAARRGRVDVVCVWSLDRLARSVSHAVEIAMELQAVSVELVSLRGDLDTTTPRGRFAFHIFSALAEMERELARERTVSGLDAARARGVTLGRPVRRDVDPDEVRELRAAGASYRAIANQKDVPLSTIFAAVNRSKNPPQFSTRRRPKTP